MSLEILTFCRKQVLGPETFGLGVNGSPFSWPSDPRSDYFTLGPLAFNIQPASEVDPEGLEGFEGVPEGFATCVTISGSASGFDSCPWPMSGSDWAEHVAAAFHGVAFFEDGERLYDGTSESAESQDRSLRLLKTGIWASANPSDKVATLDQWLRSAAQGDVSAADVLLQWSGWVRPRGTVGSTRTGNEQLGRSLLKVCQSLDTVSPCVASAFERMMFLPLLHEREAQELLRGRIEHTEFARMFASLLDIDKKDREARSLLAKARTDGDFI